LPLAFRCRSASFNFVAAARFFFFGELGSPTFFDVFGKADDGFPSECFEGFGVDVSRELRRERRVSDRWRVGLF